VTIIFIAVAICFRLTTLAISIRNEWALKRAGGQEFGKTNSVVLTLAHIAFYVSAISEYLWFPTNAPDVISLLGVLIYAFGVLVLVAVIRALGRVWTVKLIIANGHVLVTGGLYRLMRHPNYFLNILPELVGLALALNAFTTLLIGLALYAIPLAIRIREEDRLMATAFPQSGSGRRCRAT
jgi:isoprenylcysteine carboxyl methyltransferase (ICMT) family protein YpbQ